MGWLGWPVNDEDENWYWRLQFIRRRHTVPVYFLLANADIVWTWTDSLWYQLWTFNAPFPLSISHLKSKIKPWPRLWLRLPTLPTSPILTHRTNHHWLGGSQLTNASHVGFGAKPKKWDPSLSWPSNLPSIIKKMGTRSTVRVWCEWRKALRPKENTLDMLHLHTKMTGELIPKGQNQILCRANWAPTWPICGPLVVIEKWFMDVDPIEYGTLFWEERGGVVGSGLRERFFVSDLSLSRGIQYHIHGTDKIPQFLSC